MRAKPDLSAALNKVSGRVAPVTVAAPMPPEQPATASGSRAPSRRGKKAIGGYFDPLASKQLRKLGLDRDVSVQDLLQEALNDLFEKHGLSRIA